MSGRILADVVEQHAEESAFLWILRNEATRAPNHDLTSLAELDERIDAHLDGLRVAGAQGWEICREQLAWREAGEVFAAAHVALQSRIGKRLDFVLDVATESKELMRGLIAALAWLPFDEVQHAIHALLASADPCMRRIGIAASATHRWDPGVVLAAAVLDSNAVLCARAVKAAAELGRCDLLSLFGDSEAATEENSFWHAWSATLLGAQESVEPLRGIALEDGVFAAIACDLATRCVPPNDAVDWHRELVASGRCRLAIIVAGALGDPALVPWLIGLMEVESHARAAGEAFASITGVELTRGGLAAARPDAFESGPNDDPDDDNVAIDPDEHLPWPRPTAVAKWWSANKTSYMTRNRYLMGRPICASSLQQVLARGNQRQRRAAALELVLSEPGQPLFEVRARADRQLDMLRSRAQRH